jgi:copper transport protein
MPRGLLRGVVPLLASGSFALALAPAAHAHAELLQTQPARGATVASAPDHVALTFDEPVETSLGSVRVYSGSGERVDRGAVSRPRPQQVAVALDRSLRRGTYTVAWRILSEDSDPVSGAFVFHVQRAGPHPGGIAAEVLEDTPGSVTIAYDIARFFEYALVLLCAGGALSLSVVLSTAAPALRRRLYIALAALALALAAVSLLELPLQGAASAAIDLGGGFREDVVRAVLDTRFGEVALIRAVVAAGLAVAAVAAAVTLKRGFETGALALAAVALATPVAVSHASVSGRLATVADTAHISAAATWIGGLAFVTAALLLAGPERWPLAAKAVPRFSSIAVVAVAVIIAGGIVNAYLQVRSWSALWETTYGRLLLVKIALLLPLLALGALNNRYAVPRLRAAVASAVERRRFLRTIGAELALMTAIVAVTAVLVSAPPARTQHVGAFPHRNELQFGPYVGTLQVTPARAGINTVRIDFAHAEVPVMVHVSATLPSRSIGPLPTMLEHVTHPTFVNRRVQFPIAGTWALRIEARRDRSEVYTRTVTIRVAPAS